MRRIGTGLAIAALAACGWAQETLSIQYGLVKRVVSSADGQRIAVGSSLSNTGPERHVFVYDRIGGQWVLTGDIASAGGSQGFGNALDISSDGNTIVIGDPEFGFPGAVVGAAFLYRWDGAAWVQGHTFDNPTSIFNPSFGGGVGIDGDGDVLAISNRSGSSGTAHIFELQPDDTWLRFDLSGARGIPHISAAGDRIVWEVFGNAGVLILGRTSSDWVLEHAIGAAGALSAAGAVSSDGVRAAASLTVNGPDRLTISTLTPSGWVDELNLQLAEYGAYTSLAFDATGDVLLAGAPSAPDAVEVFRRVNGVWSLEETILWPDGPSAGNFGLTVAMADDFSRWFTLSTVTSIGVDVWAFEAGEPFVYCPPKPSSGACSPSISYSGSTSLGGSTPFLVTAVDVPNRKNGLFFYGTHGPAWLTVPVGLFCVQPPLRRTFPINSDGNPPPADDCSGTYAFDFTDWALNGLDPSLVPGTSVNGQFWIRDPDQVDGTGTALSNALQFELAP